MNNQDNLQYRNTGRSRRPLQSLCCSNGYMQRCDPHSQSHEAMQRIDSGINKWDEFSLVLLCSQRDGIHKTDICHSCRASIGMLSWHVWFPQQTALSAHGTEAHVWTALTVVHLLEPADLSSSIWRGENKSLLKQCRKKRILNAFKMYLFHNNGIYDIVIPFHNKNWTFNTLTAKSLKTSYILQEKDF